MGEERWTIGRRGIIRGRTLDAVEVIEVVPASRLEAAESAIVGHIQAKFDLARELEAAESVLRELVEAVEKLKATDKPEHAVDVAWHDRMGAALDVVYAVAARSILSQIEGSKP